MITLFLTVTRAIVVPAAMSTGMTTISGERMLSPRFMASLDYVASAISRLVCLEVVESLRSTFRERSNVTVMRIKPVIYMPVKAVRSMKVWMPSGVRPVETTSRELTTGHSMVAS